MQLHWVDGASGEIGKKKLARGQLADYFARLQPVRVVKEACGSAHHWARVLGALGHQVELLPAREIRRFVRSNKDDAADARAIWLASQQTDIRRVPKKSVEPQAVLALHSTRQQWVSVRAATINALRGLLYEFGVVLPGGKHTGLKAIRTHRAEIDAQEPETTRRLIDGQRDALADIERRIEQLQAEIGALQEQMDEALGLRQAPGIGLLDATALAATLGDGRGWRSGREFSASLGLVPAHKGSGAKVRIGSLSKHGDPYLRTLARRPLNVAVVALANTMARTAWALVAHGREYQREWKSTPPKGCAAQAAAA